MEKEEEAWAESKRQLPKMRTPRAPIFFQKKRKKQKQRALFYYEMLFLFLSFYLFLCIDSMCQSLKKRGLNIACRQGTLNTSERRPTTNRFSLAFFLYKFTISSPFFFFLFTIFFFPYSNSMVCIYAWLR